MKVSINRSQDPRGHHSHTPPRQLHDNHNGNLRFGRENNNFLNNIDSLCASCLINKNSTSRSIWQCQAPISTAVYLHCVVIFTPRICKEVGFDKATITSESVARRYKLLTLVTLFTLYFLILQLIFLSLFPSH